MPLVLSNAASSLLSASIDTIQTTIAITSGDEARFPNPAPGDWFPLTVVDAAGNRENMRCTGRSGVTMTVTRAQEGTTAKAFEANARVDLRLTAGAFLEHARNASRLTEGEVGDDVLPGRLRETMLLIEDADAVTGTGFYWTDADTLGLPDSSGIGHLTHRTLGSDTMYQEWQKASAADRWARRMQSGT